jgi:drug/metabolite transporter (DMT)-like permease
VFVAPRMVSGFTAVDFTAGRYLSYGALSLVLMLALRKSSLPTASQALFALGMSVLGFTGYYLLLVYAIADAGSQVPSLIIGTIPIWIMILGKPTALQWAGLVPGLVLTLLGLGLMVHATLGVTVSAPVGTHFWRGVTFAVVSMAFWTAFGLMNSAWLKKHPEVNATTWANWLGVATGLGSLVLWLVAGSDVKVLIAQQNIEQAAIICIALGVGSAWIATYLWNIASQRLSASLCGQLIVYSFIWDGHAPTGMQALACLLFVAGILASIRAHR